MLVSRRSMYYSNLVQGVPPPPFLPAFTSCDIIQTIDIQLNIESSFVLSCMVSVSNIARHLPIYLKRVRQKEYSKPGTTPQMDGTVNFANVHQGNETKPYNFKVENSNRSFLFPSVQWTDFQLWIQPVQCKVFHPSIQQSLYKPHSLQ